MLKNKFPVHLLVSFANLMRHKKNIAIVGGGPSALFMYKRLIESDEPMEIDIFERSTELGEGMPYGKNGACDEHVTNVSGNEIPDMVSSLQDWLPHAPKELLGHYKIFPENFNEYKVLPRLFFGRYLSAQFNLFLQKAKAQGVKTNVHLKSNVTDIADKADDEKVQVIAGDEIYVYDHVIICTGHSWPVTHEGKIPNYFDSPYPPSKLAMQVNYPVAIRGSSLTAIDAMRTLSRQNGYYAEKGDGMLRYTLKEGSENFKLVLHSRNGMLPAIRFHLEDPLLGKDSVLSEEEVKKKMAENDGFLPLDYVFDKNFKAAFRENDPEMYERIRTMTIEEFVEDMMTLREKMDAFTLFKAEYEQAEKSIRKKESVYWKEMLAVLSFAMNYPAKHFSAEDMLRLQKVLMPLISVVIAFVPQSSSKELIALYDAGVLEIVPVGDDGSVDPVEEGGAILHFTDEENCRQSAKYAMFVDSIGQPHLHFEQFPFKSLRDQNVISRAMVRFRSRKEGEIALSGNNKKVGKSEAGDYYLKVPGITINDYFQVVDPYGALNPRIFIMAVPYIAGYNPDYSGLDFCEASAERIAGQLLPQRS